MSKEILQDIIADFNPDKFTRFFREKNRTFSPKREEFSRYDDQDFTDGIKLGEIKFTLTEQLVVCSFEIKKLLSERSGKKAQYDKGKKILKDARADAGIFIFYDKKGDFRLSLIYANYLGKRRDWSLFRRFTYFVSREFTNKTFLQRIGDDNFPSLDKIKDAFSVEKVTKEFYEQYRRLFEGLVADLDKNRVFQKVASKNQINTADFAKKLLGQIVSLYFLQKKGWLGVPQNKPWGEGDKNFISNLYKQAVAKTENFFNDYLEILFYDTLNNAHREGADPSFSKHFNCRIPFLNGGLFEPEYDWRGTKIYLENGVFKNIFEILDRYNFTVEEDSPDDKEVAVDPEMLGKVFENLLEENLRKGQGTYYTPREIVHYMCQESLINYLKTASDLDEKIIRLLVVEKTASKLNDGDAKKLDGLLANIKVCDPACGSGAFLVGMLSELISARLIFNPRIGEYGLKKEAIQNCIYGVDIDPGAVEIAKLRLWLSLVVDYELADIEPLPNLDYKVMCGNSLLEELILGDQTIKLFDDKLLIAKTGKKDHLFEMSVGGEAFQGGRKEYLQNALKEKRAQLMELHRAGQLTAESKRELDREISLLDKELNPRIKKSKSLDAHPLLFQEKAGHYFDVLRNLHKQYFNEYDSDKKKAIRNQIGNIELEFIKSSIDEKVRNVEDQIKNLNMQNPADRKKQTGLMKKKLEYLAIPNEIHCSKVRPYFLWHLNFFEVFQEKGGFDVVIANPPYIDSESMVKNGQAGIREAIQKTYKMTKGNWDIYVAFFERGIMHMNDKGVLTFITPDKWISKPFGDELRKNTINNIFAIVKAGREVFDAAKVDSILSFFSMRPCENINIFDFLENNFVFKRTINKLTLTTPFALDHLFSDKIDFLYKIEENKNKLSDLAECENACATSDAYGLKPLIRELSKRSYSSSKEFKIINTGTIGKYVSKWGLREMTYLGHKYLCPVVDREEFVRLFKNTYQAKTLKPKIILKGLNLLDACLDEEGIVIPGKTTLIITSSNLQKLKLLLGILNSSLPIFYIKEKYPASSYNQGTTFTREMINNFPIPKMTEVEQKQLICSVEKMMGISTSKDFLNSKEKQSEAINLQAEINRQIYKLYSLKEDEIKIVEESGKSN